MKTCSFEGCGRPHYARTLCHTHYCQHRRGEPIRAIHPRRVRPPAGTRDEYGRKQCGSCDRWTSESDFARDNARPDGLTSRCKACRSAYMRAWKYGLNSDELTRRIHDQGGTCALCPASLADGYCVDHDHRCCPDTKTCGECIRGLLCDECNKLIGKLEQDRNRLAKMLHYIN